MNRKEFLSITLITSLAGITPAEVEASPSSRQGRRQPNNTSRPIPFVFRPRHPLMQVRFDATANTDHHNFLMHSPGQPKSIIRQGDHYVGLMDATTKQIINRLDTNKTVYVYQLEGNGPALNIVDPTDVIPTLAGSPDKRDIVFSVSLQSFHVGSQEAVKSNTRATLKIIAGKSQDSPDAHHLELAFWIITSGLRLLKPGINGVPEPKELSFKPTGKPVEIPGGLSNITFDILKHRTKTFWELLFGFLGQSSSLTKAIGFPALAEDAVSFIGNLLNNAADLDAKPIFTSGSLQFAMTQYAKSTYEGQNSGITIGSLNKGFWLLVRESDREALLTTKPRFNGTKSILQATTGQPQHDDILKKITYAVVKAELAATNLHPLDPPS